MEKEEVIKLLNQLQKEKLIKITNYEFPITISLRKSLEKELIPEIEAWIKEWSDLWKNKKVSTSSGDYYLAQPPKENLKRMTEFVSDNPEFTKEIIFKATLKYLNEKEPTGFQYTKKSHKFIQDMEGSTLYAYCQSIESNEPEYTSLNTRL